jgi:hypothetical protein
MLKSLISFSNNRSSVFLLVLALIVGGVGAQAKGLLNTSSGGYLVCVNSKTKVVTHPGTSKCPKGSKKLILGAQGAAGAIGLTGAAGLSGRDGIDGVNGKTLWNGTIDPLDQWGAAGDFYINYVSKNLFGPKSYNQSWPAGVSLVGPKGDQGLIGLTGAKGDQGPIGLTGATGAQGPSGGSGGSGAAGAAGAAGATGATGVAAPVVTDPTNCIGTKCTYKVGDVGPGGGLIFFVDYFGQYEDLNYLEAAPVDLPGKYAWGNNITTSVTGGDGWVTRAVGRGQANTTAIIPAYPISGAAFAADDYSSPSYNSVVKSDWFLGSLGEMKLMYDNLQGLGGLVAGLYWSSSEDTAQKAWGMYFDRDSASDTDKRGTFFVRPVRAF